MQDGLLVPLTLPSAQGSSWAREGLRWRGKISALRR